jgi:hypothetical protein
MLGGWDASKHEVRRLMVKARDGVSVPVSILIKKGTVLNGANPLLLYAYGSYGATQEATFSSARFSLVDRGMIHAIAHIRGGSEMGRQWYDDGKMLKKKNTFHDFIDVAEGLIARKYTRKDKLVINGGSAGALLMGAVVNMRPDLFHAVVADVPFVDVINTMADASLPPAAQDQHGRRARRGVGAVRPAQGDGVPVRVDAAERGTGKRRAVARRRGARARCPRHRAAEAPYQRSRAATPPRVASAPSGTTITSPSVATTRSIRSSTMSSMTDASPTRASGATRHGVPSGPTRAAGA